jgi:predicted anti-sigma-YlaC factor YlaD
VAAATIEGMACERWREMLSAQLDGEDDPADQAGVDEHLAGCAGCREWLEWAATVNRLIGTRVVADVPDLSAAIVAALSPAAGRAAAGSAAMPPGSGAAGPARAGVLERIGGRLVRRPGDRFVATLYVLLAAVGAVQLILGLTQVGGGAVGGPAHAGVDASPGHLWHESAAWNVAVGAGYLFIALRRSHPAGLVPMLTAFVGMLLLLSVNDLTAGRVDGTRLVSHGFVILGYLLVVALSRAAGDTARPPAARTGAGSGWRASFDDEEAATDPARRGPALRLVPRPPGPLTAEREERHAA